MKYLFKDKEMKADPDAFLKTFFNIMYQDKHFLDAVDRITQKIDFGVNGVGYNFPDWEDWDEALHFEGVWFTLGDHQDADEIIVSEEVCFNYLRQACERYIKKHREDRKQINEYLARVKLAPL